MINPKGVILLLVALGCAGGTAWFVDGLVGGRPATPAAAALPPPPAEETRILVAKKELATGTFLKSGDLDWQVWPEAGLNDGYVRENPNALKEFEGAVVRTRLTRGSRSPRRGWCIRARRASSPPSSIPASGRWRSRSTAPPASAALCCPATRWT